MSAGDDICEIVITAPDVDWLAAFTRRLVEDRLCTGGHITERVRSIYPWQGQVYDKHEARVALHSRMSLLPAIIERTNDEHPYEVPCVLALPIVGANPAYAQWVLDETRAP